MSMHSYPLQMSFKVLAFAPQIFVKDASGQDIFYVHQKLFKFKEDIGVFSDKSKSRELYRIKADRVIDFSARYNFVDSTSGQPVGSVKREGMRSLWKASYNIITDEHVTHHVKEDNPWLRVADAFFQEIPLVGMFAGYVFNPSYTLFSSGAEAPVLKLKKEPSFLEGKFSIHKVAEPANESEETRLILSLMMMTLLERVRG